MNISRRNFLIGGASFASLGAFGGNRFRRAAEGFSHPLKHGKAQSSQICCFLKDELGACGVRFTVTPMNCFGVRGKPISAEVKA
jgi:hypothetical protein